MTSMSRHCIRGYLRGWQKVAASIPWGRTYVDTPIGVLGPHTSKNLPLNIPYTSLPKLSPAASPHLTEPAGITLDNNNPLPALSYTGYFTPTYRGGIPYIPQRDGSDRKATVFEILKQNRQDEGKPKFGPRVGRTAGMPRSK